MQTARNYDHLPLTPEQFGILASFVTGQFVYTDDEWLAALPTLCARGYVTEKKPFAITLEGRARLAERELLLIHDLLDGMSRSRLEAVFHEHREMEQVLRVIDDRIARQVLAEVESLPEILAPPKYLTSPSFGRYHIEASVPPKRINGWQGLWCVVETASGTFVSPELTRGDAIDRAKMLSTVV